MLNALEQAKNATNMNEVPIGCVFIYNNEIIASENNLVNLTKNPTRHAEIICIDKTIDYCRKNNKNQKEYFNEVTVIVTCEPCIMCAAALNQLNVKEIIYGCKNDRFGGSTVINVDEILKNKIKVTGGVRETEAMELLKKFYKGENLLAPVPKLKKQKIN